MSDQAALVARLEQVAIRLEKALTRTGGAGASAGAAASSGGGSASLDGYDEIINGPLADFLTKSAAVGEDVATQAQIVERAFAAQRAFLAVAAESKKPADSALPALLADTSAAIGDIVSFRENNRRSKQFNHLSAVSEGIPALGWVTVSPKPAPFVKEMTAACQFYSNRVLKDFKDSDVAQADWAKSFVAVLDALHEYVKQVHTTGLVWNPKGGEAAAPAAAAPKPAAAAAPKPAAAAAAPSRPAMGGLFSELQKGGDVTKGLKKVDKTQMTHKNPELRASSVVKAVEKPAAAAAPKAAAAAAKKPPVLELQGNKKWAVEYQDGNREIVLDQVELKHSVYIYKCTNSTIQIKGKVNSITMDGCKKTAVVFEDCVAVFEFINCQSVQMQVNGRIPTVSIDKTDGCQIYLSKDSLDTEIVSAKSSEMNILVPTDDGDYTEMALPEQYKTVYDQQKKALVTTITDIAG